MLDFFFCFSLQFNRDHRSIISICARSTSNFRFLKSVKAGVVVVVVVAETRFIISKCFDHRNSRNEIVVVEYLVVDFKKKKP